MLLTARPDRETPADRQTFSQQVFLIQSYLKTGPHYEEN